LATTVAAGQLCSRGQSGRPAHSRWLDLLPSDMEVTPLCQ
jgi:hypothetical protein